MTKLLWAVALLIAGIAFAHQPSFLWLLMMLFGLGGYLQSEPQR